jgi:hypothetical protein
LTKFKGPLGLIRELLKYVDHIKSFHLYRTTGILEVVLAGRVVITAEMIEAMKESNYELKIFYNSVDPESIESGSLGDSINEIEKEEDVPYYMLTTLLLKDTEPPLENGGKSDIQALITEPFKTEFEAMRRNEACSGCNVNTKGDEDDIADE